MLDIAKLKAKAQQTEDMTKAKAGGEGYAPPAAGTCRARFIGYIETGVHETTFQGVAKKVEEVKMVFEISGPKWPSKLIDGVPTLERMTITITKSLSAKAHFFKLFQQMNVDGQATHFVELLDKEYLADIHHFEFEKRDGTGKGVGAELRGPTGYTLRSPYYEDPNTGEQLKVSAAPRVSPIRCLLWDAADKEQWDSIFIDGAYDDGKSKNVFQDRCRAALNWNGSPAQLCTSGGAALDDELAKHMPGDDSADPLE